MPYRETQSENDFRRFLEIYESDSQLLVTARDEIHVAVMGSMVQTKQAINQVIDSTLIINGAESCLSDGVRRMPVTTEILSEYQGYLEGYYKLPLGLRKRIDKEVKFEGKEIIFGKMISEIPQNMNSRWIFSRGVARPEDVIGNLLETHLSYAKKYSKVDVDKNVILEILEMILRRTAVINQSVILNYLHDGLNNKGWAAVQRDLKPGDMSRLLRIAEKSVDYSEQFFSKYDNSGDTAIPSIIHQSRVYYGKPEFLDVLGQVAIRAGGDATDFLADLISGKDRNLLKIYAGGVIHLCSIDLNQRGSVVKALIMAGHLMNSVEDFVTVIRELENTQMVIGEKGLKFSAEAAIISGGDLELFKKVQLIIREKGKAKSGDKGVAWIQKLVEKQ